MSEFLVRKGMIVFVEGETTRGEEAALLGGRVQR